MKVARSVEIREVEAIADLRAVEALFVSIWSTSADQPPINADILRALAHTGCYVAGAFEEGRLLGASVGFLGGIKSDLHLHSHITGVAAEAQGRQVGRGLKLHQREWCLQRGIEEITWTYDPLIRRNGWFNLQRLGADIVGFERDFYGEMRDGLNAGDRSDRCLVRWVLSAAGERDPLTVEGPLVLAAGPAREPVLHRSGAPIRRLQVPADFERLRREDPVLVRAWRDAFRAAFVEAMEDGLTVAGMTADGEYVLRA